MRRALELILFLAMAGGLHLAGLAQLPTPKGADSAGQAGQAVASVQATSQAVIEMVERWERPPKVAPQIDAPKAVQPPDAPMQLPEPVMSETVRRSPAPGLSIPQTDSAPDARVAKAPPPPPKPEPKVQPAKERPTPAQANPKPKPKPAPKAPPRKAAQASGAGGGADAGNAKSSRAATLSKGQIQSLAAQWGAQIRRKIERRKRYPSGARGASGTVTLRIAVSRAGALRGVSIARSSGNSALDKAAMRAVRAARRFPTAPNALTKSSYSFTLAMQFKR
ncbi:energy transducer TonB [Roseovarius sp. A21]|uniref:Energy transducer TonB n=1 Tax=Roseovarius bejariae TaxID=2576383 RepID=A0A844CSJ4_9RHOB|nr:energy transducer TonB [Roseovarius bejariae]MRU14969.1 energy transducer TonB [Roseovarius bejariae]